MPKLSENSFPPQRNRYNSLTTQQNKNNKGILMSVLALAVCEIEGAYA